MARITCSVPYPRALKANLAVMTPESARLTGRRRKMYGDDCARAMLLLSRMRNRVEESPTIKPTTLARRNHLATLRNRMESSVRRVVMNRQVRRKVTKAATSRRIVHLEHENDKSLEGLVAFVVLVLTH